MNSRPNDETTNDMDRESEEKPAGHLPAPYQTAALSLHRMLMPDREAETLRAHCMSGGEWEYGRWLMLNPPDQAIKARLEKRHRDIVTNMSHHDVKAIGAAVADAIACYRNFIKKDENPRSVITKYVKELEGIPTWACVRACDAIRHNQAPGISLEYPFNTTQLRALAESYITRLQNEAREISQIMLGGRLPPPATPEQQARIKRGMLRLAFQMKSDRKREERELHAPILARMKQRNDEAIIHDYQRRGETPVSTGGILVSRQLIESLNSNGGVSYADRGGDGRSPETTPSPQGNQK